MEKVRAWCGQPSDRGRLKNRTNAKKLTDSQLNPARRAAKQVKECMGRGSATVIFGVGQGGRRGANVLTRRRPLISLVRCGHTLSSLVHSTRTKLTRLHQALSRSRSQSAVTPHRPASYWLATDSELGRIVLNTSIPV